MEVALAARVKHTGLPEKLAVDQQAATELGRLWLHGVISLGERMAGEALVKIRADALSAIEAPIGMIMDDGRSGKDWDAMDREARKEFADKATKLVARWKVAEMWLKDCNMLGFEEVMRVCFENVPPRNERLLGAMLTLLATRLGFAVAAAT